MHMCALVFYNNKCVTVLYLPQIPRITSILVILFDPTVETLFLLLGVGLGVKQ